MLTVANETGAPVMGALLRNNLSDGRLDRTVLCRCCGRKVTAPSLRTSTPWFPAATRKLAPAGRNA